MSFAGATNESADTALIEAIRRLAPWHHDIAITETVSTGRVFAADGSLSPAQNQGVALQHFESGFRSELTQLFPGGLAGRRMLDCACNAGAYSFAFRAAGGEEAFGFDVRDHWIQQARFVQRHRVVGPTDRLRFERLDLYSLKDQGLSSFDLTMFKGIFYHLPDPIAGLQMASDLTRDILYFDSRATFGDPDGRLVAKFESPAGLMSGAHGLSWLPSGPKVVASILRSMGFRSARLAFLRTLQDGAGRLRLYAAREASRLTHLTKMPELIPGPL